VVDAADRENAARCRRLAANVLNQSDPIVGVLLALADEFDTARNATAKPSLQHARTATRVSRAISMELCAASRREVAEAAKVIGLSLRAIEDSRVLLERTGLRGPLLRRGAG
jgi:hypothetical protein